MPLFTRLATTFDDEQFRARDGILSDPGNSGPLETKCSNVMAGSFGNLNSDGRTCHGNRA